ncbi:hypothetical protein NDU88_006163 [Pleurodeles waltl]|uniref:Uncharacterized protein n=1 Tax=Pleurodeles waltl TaxID=8319 RepID=A0AAV7UKQ4_PLEWA|nr:hypothetical protein NDU88_006163 [Pleurodeles waltl]
MPLQTIRTMGFGSGYYLSCLSMTEEECDDGVGLSCVSFMQGTNSLGPLELQYQGEDEACEFRSVTLYWKLAMSARIELEAVERSVILEFVVSRRQPTASITWSMRSMAVTRTCLLRRP